MQTSLFICVVRCFRLSFSLLTSKPNCIPISIDENIHEIMSMQNICKRCTIMELMRNNVSTENTRARILLHWFITATATTNTTPRTATASNLNCICLIWPYPLHATPMYLQLIFIYFLGLSNACRSLCVYVVFRFDTRRDYSR